MLSVCWHAPIWPSPFTQSVGKKFTYCEGYIDFFFFFFFCHLIQVIWVGRASEGGGDGHQETGKEKPGQRWQVDVLQLKFNVLVLRNCTADLSCYMLCTWAVLTTNRCIADHHREGQFPFLDEEVVAYLQQLPVHCKVHVPPIIHITNTSYNICTVVQYYGGFPLTAMESSSTLCAQN